MGCPKSQGLIGDFAMTRARTCCCSASMESDQGQNTSGPSCQWRSSSSSSSWCSTTSPFAGRHLLQAGLVDLEAGAALQAHLEPVGIRAIDDLPNARLV